MKQPLIGWALLVGVTILSIALRFGHLEQRPMHCDEAVHAVKFGTLLEKGVYRYDPYEFHGPTLNYFTLVSAWLSNIKDQAKVNEFTLRAVPAFFGVLLVVLTCLLAGGVGWTAVIFAALFTAISPAMVYYSRYYIQEMLLVCFTFAALISGYRYVSRPGTGWALLLGVFLGLMYATKETCVIAFAAMAAAVCLLLLQRKFAGKPLCPQKGLFRPVHIAAVLGGGLFISLLFYSSFGSNWRGIVDSVLSYGTYFYRAGDNQSHINPWYYYLRILLFYKNGDGPVWSEGIIILLALGGIIGAFTKRDVSASGRYLWRFLVFYTLLLTVFYSVIPYKTPWCMLSFLHGFILLAGLGAWVVLSSGKWLRWGAVLALLLGIVLLLRLDYLGNGKYRADIHNPYVYAHTSEDIYRIVAEVETAARAALKLYDYQQKSEPVIQVFFPDNFWPLPWYLRDFDDPAQPKRIEWKKTVPPGSLPAAVVLAEPRLEADIMDMFFKNPPPGEREMYMPLFDTYDGSLDLRPYVPVRGYIRKSLWDVLQQEK